MDDFTKELIIDLLASEIVCLRAELKIADKNQDKELQKAGKNLWKQLEWLAGAANSLLVQLSEEFQYLVADDDSNELKPILENFINLVDSSQNILAEEQHQVFSSQEQPEQI